MDPQQKPSFDVHISRCAVHQAVLTEDCDSRLTMELFGPPLLTVLSTPPPLPSSRSSVSEDPSRSLESLLSSSSSSSLRSYNR